MTNNPKSEQVIETDLLIIGSGLSGMAAAVFAAQRNICTVITGAAGGFEYASGMMDLWGVSLTNKNRPTKKPWDMLNMLCRIERHHPLARLTQGELSRAFEQLLSVLRDNHLEYTGYKKLNHAVLTPFGTVHQTYRLPRSLQENARAFKVKKPGLIIDFKGLREFSAKFFCEMVKEKWPGIEPGCITFPGTRIRSEIFTPYMALQMETEKIQDAFIKKLKPRLKGKSCLGLPAMIGVQSCETIRQRLEQECRVSIFEIPTSPVSVPGMRLKEALNRSIENSSVNMLSNQRITKVKKIPGQGFECLVDQLSGQTRIISKAIVLATGRFLSKGLVADRKKVVEPLFGLNVIQPGARSLWHEKEYFNTKGHQLNRAGIETDDQFRPVNASGAVVDEHLFVCGSILAHQDWVRTKCGSSLAVGTSYKAVESYLQNKDGA